MSDIKKLIEVLEALQKSGGKIEGVQVVKMSGKKGEPCENCGEVHDDMDSADLDGAISKMISEIENIEIANKKDDSDEIVLKSLPLKKEAKKMVVDLIKLTEEGLETVKRLRDIVQTCEALNKKMWGQIELDVKSGGHMKINRKTMEVEIMGKRDKKSDSSKPVKSPIQPM